MSSTIHVLTGVILCSTLYLTSGRSATAAQVPVWVSGQDGYHTYRIPSVIRTKASTLLAFCEGRVSGRGDAGDIDLLLKRSTDGGRTWSIQTVLWNDGRNTCGNPCPVLDDSTGTIWLLLTHNLGHDRETDIIRKKSESTRSVYVCSSSDDGQTWTTPVDITSTAKDPSWGWYATGPGIGIQIRSGPHAGRLVIPCDHSYDDPQGQLREGPFGFGAHVVFSDDHGATWQRGGVIRPHSNECQVVELTEPPGALLMNSRSYFGRSRRTHSISADGGISWSDPLDAEDLPEPVCQASLLRHSWPADVSADKPPEAIRTADAGIILFSNPADTKQRIRLTVRASQDDGRSWSKKLVLHAGPAAYSCLVSLSPATAGCLYEAGDKNPYEGIFFEQFSLNDLKEP